MSTDILETADRLRAQLAALEERSDVNRELVIANCLAALQAVRDEQIGPRKRIQVQGAIAQALQALGRRAA